MPIVSKLRDKLLESEFDAVVVTDAALEDVKPVAFDNGQSIAGGVLRLRLASNVNKS